VPNATTVRLTISAGISSLNDSAAAPRTSASPAPSGSARPEATSTKSMKLFARRGRFGDGPGPFAGRWLHIGVAPVL
jgi:hypothetical protein